MYWNEWEMYEKQFQIEFFKNMQLFDLNIMYIIIVKFGDIFYTALKYCLIVIDLVF